MNNNVKLQYNHFLNKITNTKLRLRAHKVYVKLCSIVGQQDESVGK